MSNINFPQELVDRVMGQVADCSRATLIVMSRVCKSWAHISRAHLLSILVFKNEQDIIDFLTLLEVPYHTFPHPIQCQELGLNNATTISEETPTSVRDLLCSIIVKKSLKVHVAGGRIPTVICEASDTAWRNIGQLTLSGEEYNPQAFFHYLHCFTQLTALRLEDFSLAEIVDGTGSPILPSLPSNLRSLSTIRSSRVWTFFRHHVIPSQGFPGIQHLHIQALFCFEEPGVWDMMEYLNTTQGIETLRLDALYDPNSRDLVANMQYILSTKELRVTKLLGLRRLDLDFSRMPAKFALETLIAHAFFVPSCAPHLNVAVEIHLPVCPTLWDQSNPDQQLQQILHDTSPPETPPTTGQCTLTLRGFPGFLPGGVQAGVSMARVCGYPVTIVEASREQVEEGETPRMVLRALAFGLWRCLKDPIIGFCVWVLGLWRHYLVG